MQVREGDPINIDVTRPGATLALGMMFFDSGRCCFDFTFSLACLRLYMTSFKVVCSMYCINLIPLIFLRQLFHRLLDDASSHATPPGVRPTGLSDAQGHRQGSCALVQGGAVHAVGGGTGAGVDKALLLSQA